MNPRQKTNRRRRGSALLIISQVVFALSAFVGVYMYSNAQTVQSENTVRKNESAATAVAEYAVELAAGNLSDMDFVYDADGEPVRLAVDSDGSVLDWVRRNPYGSGDALKTQRRITGTYGGEYEYEVAVTSVREARKLQEAGNPEARPDGWLAGIKLGKDGSDRVQDFTGAYEIVAAARHKSWDKSSRHAAEAFARTVVNLAYNSIATKQEQAAIYAADVPGNVESPEFGTENIKVSGEDHYAVKAAVKNIVDEQVIEGLASIKATPSELYSVINPYWTWGKMTLHYLLGDTENPKVPRTTAFSTSAIDRQMIVLDPLQPADQYIYGGKRASTDYTNTDPTTNSSVMYEKGRSVTLDPNDPLLINETTQGQATPNPSVPGSMAGSTLAVGKYENVLKLYLNYIEPSGSASQWPNNTASAATVDSWKQNNWRQMTLGYHSKAETKATSNEMSVQRRPLDNVKSPKRRRWATLMWIKNEAGQFLVREYTGSYAIASNRQAEPNGTWTGCYTWAYYGGYNSLYKYHLGAWIDPKVIPMDNNKSKDGVWGNYRNNSKHLNTRFLNLEELLGFRVTKPGYKNAGDPYDPHAVPAKLDAAGNVIPGTPEFVLDSSGERIPYTPTPSGDTVFDEVYQRDLSRGDNNGFTAADIAKMPPTDGIYVRVADSAGPGEYDWTSPITNGKYKRYTTPQDFAYPRNIADASEEPDVRDMTSLHMVLESEPESTSQNNGVLYFDMGLTVTIVYPKMVSGATDDTFLSDEHFRHWWEGDSEESLTGELSHKALSSVMDKAAVEGISDPADKLKAYFEQFGLAAHFTSGEDIKGLYTLTGEDGRMSGFGRVRFIPDTITLDFDKCGLPGPDNVFYYGDDNLAEAYEFNLDLYLPSEFARQNPALYEAVKDDPELYNAELEAWREKIARQQMLIHNPTYNSMAPIFMHVRSRFDGASAVPPVTVNVKNELSESRFDSFLFQPEDLTTRLFSADLFGFKNVRLPTAYAKIKDDGSLAPLTYLDMGESSADEVAKTEKTIYFLAGESNLVFNNESDPTMPEPGPGLKNDSAQPYIPLAWRDGKKQHNGRPLDPKFIWMDPSHGSENITTIHNPPEWFIGNDPDASGFPSRNLMTELLRFQKREHRGLIGWHREGPEATVPENLDSLTADEYKIMYGDHYEYVVMAKQGFNPYKTVQGRDSDGNTKTYLAAVHPKLEASENYDLNRARVMLKSPEEMPTFVIDGEPLDGAGMLEVQGNLVIKTTFAYHGTLVVLGNVYVEPELYDAINNKGEVIDSDGNVLIFDSGVNKWYFVDDGGQKNYTSSPAQAPRGELIVQGKIMVGGTINVAEAKTENGIDFPAGKVDIRGSAGALKDTTYLWTKAAPNEGFESGRLGWSSGNVDGIGSGYTFWKKR